MEGALINLPAIFIVIVLVITALLVIGVRESARFNAAMVAVKLVAIVFFLIVLARAFGFFFIVLAGRPAKGSVLSEGTETTTVDTS